MQTAVIRTNGVHVWKWWPPKCSQFVDHSRSLLCSPGLDRHTGWPVTKTLCLKTRQSKLLIAARTGQTFTKNSRTSVNVNWESGCKWASRMVEMRWWTLDVDSRDAQAPWPAHPRASGPLTHSARRQNWIRQMLRSTGFVSPKPTLSNVYITPNTKWQLKRSKQSTGRCTR